MLSKEYNIKLIADFHIHSHYSVATSKNLTPEYLNKWAQLKGINIVGTGDFTHPGWLKELEEKLEPAEPGLFRLKDEFEDKFKYEIFDSCRRQTRFILTSEISSIYKKNDKVRKVHNLIFAPRFEDVKAIQSRLEKIGNIRSDGRPILGLDSKNLLDLVLTVSEDCFFVPAHIWTPWFSVLGSKSGFDSIRECYEELTKHIHAIETGLSSDPTMNWRCSFLDDFSIISNSDAHSPENLGREANLFDTDLSYYSLTNALKGTGLKEFKGTIEFFPQEGKYHFDGHRKCGISMDPVASAENNFKCPVCGKDLTLGVMHRVVELADRNETGQRKNRLGFFSLIPFKEILSEIHNKRKGSKKINEIYLDYLERFGSEFDILLHLPLDRFDRENPLLKEAISRMRSGNVYIEEGYDGEYGKIRVFDDTELKDFNKDLFFVSDKNEMPGKKKDKSVLDIEKFKELNKKKKDRLFFSMENEDRTEPDEELNESQKSAINYTEGASLIIAGPGTGKTRTLIYKIKKIIDAGVNPVNILNLTFSNHAAREILNRLKSLINNDEILSKLNVFTFHSYGLSVINENIDLSGRKKNYYIIDSAEKEKILTRVLKIGQQDLKKIINEISRIKQENAGDVPDGNIWEIFNAYNVFLTENNLFDFDDLLYVPFKTFLDHTEILRDQSERYRWINIDEYQDINFIQYSLVKMIAGANKKNNIVTAVGDPNQAIYGFRGASVKYIEDFRNDYPDSRTFVLDKSYRCPDNIINASRQVVNSKNFYFLKGVEQGLKIRIEEYETQKTESEFIARKIEEMIGGLRFFSIDSGIAGHDGSGYGLKDFAVFCRTSGQFDYIEKAFNDHSIPYQKIGEEPFYNKPPFYDMLGIMKSVIKRNNSFLMNILTTGNLKISGETIKILRELFVKDGLNALYKKIIEEYFTGGIDKYKFEFELLNELTLEYERYPEGFMNFLEDSKSIDVLKDSYENVKLMTMHSSKGLEFDNVFIAGCSDKYLPFSLYENYAVDTEEEKRLLYVAMTRAKKNLFMTYTKKIELFGRNISTGKSPFLENISKELIEFRTKNPKKFKNKEDDKQLDLF